MLMILPFLFTNLAESEPVEILQYKVGNIIRVYTENSIPKDKILHNKLVKAINPKDFVKPVNFTMSAHHSLVSDKNIIATIAFPSVNLNNVRYYNVYFKNGKFSHKEFKSTQYEAGIQFFEKEIKVDTFMNNVPTNKYDEAIKFILELSK